MTKLTDERIATLVDRGGSHHEKPAQVARQLRPAAALVRRPRSIPLHHPHHFHHDPWVDPQPCGHEAIDPFERLPPLDAADPAGMDHQAERAGDIAAKHPRHATGDGVIHRQQVPLAGKDLGLPLAKPGLEGFLAGHATHTLIPDAYPWVSMWPGEFDKDHEYQLAMEIRGRGAKRQLEALEALMGHALSRPELAKRIQGKGAPAVVTKTIRALDQKGLVRLGLMPDLKTQRIELSSLGARALLVSQQMLPDSYRHAVTRRGVEA